MQEFYSHIPYQESVRHGQPSEAQGLAGQLIRARASAIGSIRVRATELLPFGFVMVCLQGIAVYTWYWDVCAENLKS